ncbi:MAG: porin family protein [Alphaproteobacteria bacterium]|nr:porin family protein [Alphaproteobacteria bacterium]
MNLSNIRLGVLAGASLLALGLVSNTASATDYKPYVSVFGGASLLNDFTLSTRPYSHYTVSSNMGYIVGATVGAKWDDRFRTEIELSHAVWGAKDFHYQGDGSSNGTASGNINATYLLANLWLDMPTGGMVTPYVGGGAGIGWANADVTFIGTGGEGFVNGSGGFAFQVGGGIKIAASENIDIDIGYRLKDLTNVVFTDRDFPVNFGPVSLVSHNFQVGMTYKF